MVKLEKVFLQITRFFIFAALLSPVISSNYFLFPYMQPAVFLFQTFILLAAISLCVLFALNSTYRPPINNLTIVITVFFAIQLLLVFTGVNPLKSFGGSVERLDGVWNILHYWLFMIVTLSVFRDLKEIKKLIIFSMLVSLFGSLRYLIFYALHLTKYPTYPFGNPGFFANYIMPHIPLALWVLITAKSREIRIFLGAFIIMQTAVVINTGNRAVFLGLMSMVFMLGIYFIFQYKKLRKIIAGGLILVFVSFGLLVAFRNTPTIQKIYFLQKITDWSLHSETVVKRLSIWNMAINAIKEKPVFGWGRENFNNVFAKHYDPKFYNFNSSEQWIDRSHNVILDELVFGGIVGGLAGLILIAFFVYYLVRALRKYSDDPDHLHLPAILLCIIAVYFVQTAFTPNSFASYLPLFIAFIATTLMSSKTESPINHAFLNTRSIRIIGGCVAITAFVVSWINFTLTPARVSNYTVMAAIQIHKKDVEKFKYFNDKIDGLLPDNNPYKADSIMFEGIGLYTAGESPGKSDMVRPFQDYFIPKLEKISEIHSYAPRLAGVYASNVSTLARITRSEKDIKKAIAVWEDTVEEYPQFQLFFVSLGGVYALDGQIQRSLDAINKAIELSTRETTGVLRWRGGLSLMTAGWYSDGLNLLSSAAEIGFLPYDGDIPFAFKMAGILTKSKNTITFARDVYLAILKVDPAGPYTPLVHGNLSIVYGQLGEKDLAQKEALEAVRTAPLMDKQLEHFQ